MIRRLLDSPRLYFGLAGLLVIVAVASMFEIHIPSRPVGTVEDISRLRERGDLNVIFLLIDTLRADRLGSYGYQRPTSRVMDDLAAHGVRFAHVEAQSSWTKCSMASLLTGLNPMRTGVTRFNDAFPPDAVLPAERFKQAGYTTVGIFRNGWVSTNFGFGQGFDTYLRPAPSRGEGRLKRRTPGAHPLSGSDEDLTLAAREFIRTRGHEKFFLYAHYMDVHQYMYDQEAADQGFGGGYSDAYDSAIHWVDRNLGVLLTELEERDLFEKTLVVIASDHGEAFLEHGFEGHAKDLYREVMEVPLIMALPFLLKPGVVVEPMVRNIDIWPTILDIAGLEPLPNADGRSLLPLIEAASRGEQPSPAGSEAIALGFLDQSWARSEDPSNPLISVWKDGLRYVRRPVADGRDELYDQREDQLEQTNLLESRPESVADLKAEADGSLNLEVPWGETLEVEIDEMYREQLKALGYVVK